MHSQLLSICITVKNRSRVRAGGRELLLFPKCVESIARSHAAATDVELVVADWQSDDWELAQWLERTAHPVPVRTLTLAGTFSRGSGLNAAARLARGEYLFFIDADALVSESVIRRGVNAVQQGNAYFPILYSFDDPDHRTGHWRDSGFGHCLITREAHVTAGGWPEYCAWGSEDDVFYARISKLFPVVREHGVGLYHQWHPDDIDFKNRYGEETDAIRNIRARAKQAKLERQTQERLRHIMRRGARYILVDEDRTDITEDVVGCPIPFLERNGKYWGPPADDTHAIRELERLRKAGAEFIVFPWVADWWLNHYSAFVEHLNKTARCVEKNDLVTVYDLQSAILSNQTQHEGL